MKIALMIIDLQKAFYARAPETFTQAVHHANRLIEAFRRKGHPVIWVQHANQDVQPETPQYAFVEGLNPLQGEFRVHKTYGSAFHDGRLKEFLNEQGIKKVYLCGFAAENCILSTARGAMDVDIQPILVEETVVSMHPDKKACVLDLQVHLTVEELIEILERP